LERIFYTLYSVQQAYINVKNSSEKKARKRLLKELNVKEWKNIETARIGEVLFAQGRISSITR